MTRQQPNTALLITIGAVSGFLLLVLMIGVQAWYLGEVQREVAIKYDNTPIQPVYDLKLSQKENIERFRWIDQSKNIAAIPIEDAMKAIIQNHGRLPTTQPKG